MASVIAEKLSNTLLSVWAQDEDGLKRSVLISNGRLLSWSLNSPPLNSQSATGYIMFKLDWILVSSCPLPQSGKGTEVTGSSLAAQCGTHGESGVDTRGPVRKKAPHWNSSAETALFQS
ncbi:hypothetical protein Bbelb_252820 [Branchiostoma belcheri]|nr:hypothetical protein Bbelb_252820 [Branchiostoma belcheri]